MVSIFISYPSLLMLFISALPRIYQVMFRLDQTLPISQQAELIALQIQTDTLPIIRLTSAKIGALANILSNQLQKEEDQEKQKIYKKGVRSLLLISMRKKELQECGLDIQIETKRKVLDQRKKELPVFDKKTGFSAEILNKTENVEKGLQKKGKGQQSTIRQRQKGSFEGYLEAFKTKRVKKVEFSEEQSQQELETLLKKKNL